MKKLLLSAIALVAFSSANAQLSESGKGKGYIRVAPKEFCYDGKVKLIMDETEYGEPTSIFKIYDSNFEVEKTVTLNLGYGASRSAIRSIYFEFSDYDNNRCVEQGFNISQTLFNNDEKYEALVPKYTQKEVMDPTGLSVVSEDGTELYSIELGFALPEYSDYFKLMKINGKLYIAVQDETYDNYVFFEINRETSSIKQVAKLKGMRVSPTIAEQTDNITVELGEGSNAKEIVVVNGNGQVVKQIPVKNGERQITINAGSLNRGLNILNARGAKGNNNCKIIVK